MIAYALPAFSLAVVGIPVYIYIPKFYTDIIGVDIAVVGILLFAVRLFDAVTDPLIGLISDRTRTPFGRRRPYIAIGSVFLAFFLFLLFNPSLFSIFHPEYWLGINLFALFLFWTLVTVPYESLGPEITNDYNERTTLFSLRDGFLIGGTLMAASSPELISRIYNLPETPAGEVEKFFLMSAVYGPLLIACAFICTAAITEQYPVNSPFPKQTTRFSLFKNRPFLILLIAYTIAAFGSNLPATLILYYVEYVLQADNAELYLAIYFITGILFLPLWIYIAGRTDKKRAWIGSMVVNTGAFTGVFFLGAGDAFWYGLLVFLSGIGFGASLALPSAIQADVIDYDELMTGSRREGQYIGIWSIAKKMAAAAGIGIGLTVLGTAGYQANTQQPEAVVLTLRILYALVPCLCNILSILVLTLYPITESMHQTILEKIAYKKQNQ